MPLSPAFRRVGAVCWMATGVTTLGLIFLPRFLPPTPDLVARAEVWTSPLAFTRLWIGVVHPMLAMVAFLGIASVLVARAPSRVVVGTLSMLVWGICELVQQALLLVALSWSLYPSYLAADAAARPELAASIGAVRAAADALFFVLLIAFVAGHLLFGWAMPKTRRLDRVVATIFVLAAGLGVVSFLTSYGQGVLPPAVMAVLYPLIQPAGRALTGVWLWQQAETG